jgi:hypothetical protein
VKKVRRPIQLVKEAAVVSTLGATIVSLAYGSRVRADHMSWIRVVLRSLDQPHLSALQVKRDYATVSFEEQGTFALGEANHGDDDTEWLE